jgi:hypothetical protein
VIGARTLVLGERGVGIGHAARDPDRAQTRAARARDVGAQAVAHVQRVGRVRAEPRDHLGEDLGTRLAQAECVRDDERAGIEPLAQTRVVRARRARSRSG